MATVYRLFRLLPLLSIVLPFLIAGSSDALGQVGSSGVVRGIVHSVEGAPLPSALIALRRSADTLLIAGQMTDSIGAFRIGGVAPGSYVVDIRRLGSSPVTRNVTITAFRDDVDLGIIRLEPAVIALEEVDVSAARAPFVTLPDRNVYSTSEMPAAGGTATEVLRSIPELEVSVEGRVTARGATPTIHINGRAPPVQGAALDRYLQQLPAERIDRIEVISNPSARYEAEGQGGIVNIIMKRKTGLGLSGTVAVNAATRNQLGGSGNVNYDVGRVTLFGASSVSFSESSSENSDMRQNLNSEPPTFIQQDFRNRSSGSLATLDLAAELNVGARGTAWTDAAIGRNALGTDAHSAYAHLDHLRATTDRYDRANESDFRGLFGSWSVGYREVEEGGSEWSAELRRTFNDDDHVSESAKNWLSLEGAPLDRAPELSFAGEGQDHRDWSLDASVLRDFGESGQLEAGYRVSWQHSGSDFRTQIDSQGGASMPDELVGDFRNRETIHAAFVTASRQLGRMYVQAGIRGEQAEVRRTLPRSDETFETSYRNLFPNVLVSTGLGAAGQLSLSYSKRVDRPWDEILNPATPVLDPLNRRFGNPYLTPRYTHSLSLKVTQAAGVGMLQLSPYYRRTVNSWDQVRSVDEAGVSTVTWQNLATISAYGASFSASLAPVGAVSGFVNLSGYREVRRANMQVTDFSGSSTRFSVIGTANVRATSALNVNGTLTYLPGRDLPQGSISSMVFSTVGARVQLRDGRVSINGSVVDPFDLQRFTFTTRDRSHVQTGRSTFSARRATLGITYSFGRPPEREGRRSAREEDQQENRTPVIR